jgi:Uma2 family endonuclease
MKTNTGTVDPTQPCTAGDLLHLPHDGRYELVRGELRKMPFSVMGEGLVAARFGAYLSLYVQEQQLGETVSGCGFILARDPDTVRAPDVAFISREPGPNIDQETGFVIGAPDLAAEVIAPSDLYADVEEKVREWLAAGTRLVVIVNPWGHTIAICRSETERQLLTEADTLDGGSVVPGWTMPVRELFT